MTIQELSDKIQAIALDDVQLRSYFVGNTWDMSNGKEDTYPNLWLELPVLLEYNGQNRLYKTFTFSVDILMMPELDNVPDELDKISQCEIYADQFLQYLSQDSDFTLLNFPSAITVKTINADQACGVRLDIKVNTGRVCL